MKKKFCILLAALMICCAALAESGSPSPTAGVMMITPTPSAMPSRRSCFQAVPI